MALLRLVYVENSCWRDGRRHGGLFSLQTCLEQMVCVKWHPQDRLNQGFSQLNMKPSVSQAVGCSPASRLTRGKLRPCVIRPGLTPGLEQKSGYFHHRMSFCSALAVIKLRGPGPGDLWTAFAPDCVCQVA